MGVIKRKPTSSEVNTGQKNRHSYCLLLGLEHDVTVIETIPYPEQRYLLKRIEAIKQCLGGTNHDR